MPDGFSQRPLPPAAPPAPPRPARTGRGYAVAGGIALALHAAVLLPLLWPGADPTPATFVAAVEVTSIPEQSFSQPRTAASVTEATPAVSGTESAVTPPPPDPQPPVPDAVTADTPPPEPTLPPPLPDATMAQQLPEPAARPVPDAVEALSSPDPVATEQPSEIVHADTPPPEASRPVAPPPPLPLSAHPPRSRAATRPLARPPAPVAGPVVAGPVVAGPVVAGPVVAAPSPAPAAAPMAAASPPASPASGAVATWRGDLIARLQRAKRYPPSARSSGEQGIAVATFTVDRAGHVLSATLARSSGSAALDEEAVALIRRAAPLPSMPPDMPGTTTTLTVPISFQLR